MLGGLLWKDWAFAVLIGTIAVLCLVEYFRLTDRIAGARTVAFLRLGTILFTVLYLGLLWMDTFVPLHVSSETEAWESITVFRALSPGLLCIPTLILLSTLWKNVTVESAFAAAGGLAYIVLPCALLLLIRSIDPIWPLVLILCIWTNDTMAYLVGSLTGRTPFSSISPKKTWEGTIGGAVLTVVGAAIWAYFSEGYRMVDAVAIALCAAVAGTAGDLFESKLKRLAGVKDSGRLMPGHGGALDRFDSLLVATPFAFCYLYLTV